MDIKISVIIPVYNMAKYLSECLNSIVHQSLKEIEIIAVNDGSTDESLFILEKYAHQYDNIKIFTQQNLGAGMARNNGIKLAQGKYLAVIDPDDYYPSSDCLEVLYNTAEEHDVLICGGMIMRNYNGKKSLWDKKGIDRYFCNTIVNISDYPEIYGHQRYIYNTDMIKKNNILYLSCRRYEDQYFVLKALVCAQQFYGLNKVVYEYRRGYKHAEYSLKTSRDILFGIKEVLKVVRENNLMLVYENRIKNINKEYIIPFYKYSFCGNKEIDEQIEEINAIVEEWIGKDEELILSKFSVESMKEESRKEYQAIMSDLSDEKLKIIYGSGIKAHDFIKRYHHKMKNVLGIAVTKKESNSDNIIENLTIKQIEEYLPYREEAQVIIVTISEYHKEIEQNLNKLEFQHIIKPDMKKIELAEVLD